MKSDSVTRNPWLMNYKASFLLIVFTAALIASLRADDFTLAKLPSFAHNFDLTKASDSGKNTFYKFIHDTLAPEMESLAPSAGKVPNQQALEQGLGVAVRLDDNNYNIHENFPKSAQGGRSYGWTSGQVGDWSDKMYLDNLALVIVENIILTGPICRFFPIPLTLFSSDIISFKIRRKFKFRSIIF